MDNDGRKIRTIEVAALAQISQSTVSRALAGDKRISQATRDRVLAAAQELGYRPNLIARGLKNRSTGIVGVIVTDLDNTYHAHALQLLIDEMGQRNLAPLVFVCNATERAGAVISRLAGYQVDAFIALAAPFSAEIVKSCGEGKKPLVLMNRYDGPEDVSTVGGDGAAGGALVADHLVAQGARSFAFMAGEDSTLISAEREAGFTSRLAELGHACRRRAASAYSYAEARRTAAELLADPPDAVFCANDTLAFALMDTARQDLGYAVPRRIMVAGYDNSALSAWSTYDLTSVDQSLGDMTSQTVAVTLSMITDPDKEPSRHVVAPRLVVRGSTSPHSPSGNQNAKSSDRL